MTKQQLERGKDLDAKMTEIGNLLNMARSVERITMSNLETGFLLCINLDEKNHTLEKCVVKFKENLISELIRMEQETLNEFDSL